MVRYSAFDSTTILKGSAYEVGLNIREAQVRSVGASRTESGFSIPFGVSFDITSAANRKQYIIFSDSDDDNPPFFDGAGVDELIQTITLGRTIQIDSLCVTNGGGEVCGGIERVDISFRRPEYRSLIYASDGSGSIAGVTSARIRLSSTNNPSNVFNIIVSQLGQINVKVE